ncbi:MAG: hypothetical protein JKY65_04910 [Planctomycetes bacterium]|nr:hypothetical protein [Planctomycetota bacterium]
MFTEVLKLDLTLATGATTSKIGCGDIEHFELKLHAWGFEAEVTFSTWAERAEEDPCFEALSALKPVTARLEVSSARAPTPAPDSLIAAGVVTQSSVVEHMLGGLSDRPLRRREITVCFADAAQVLWAQHYPCELVADTALGKVIKRQLVAGITLEQKWSLLAEEHPLVCLGLGVDPGGASFYDFLLWYTDAHGGAFTFDAQESSYSLAGAKPKLGSPGTLPVFDTAGVRTVAPARARHEVRLLDAQAVAPTESTVANEDFVTGVRRDVLLLPPTPLAFKAAEATETACLVAAGPDPHLEIELARFPSVSLSPGARVKTATAAGWSAKSWAANRSLRVFDYTLQASASAAPGDESGLSERVFEVEGLAKLEQETDPAQRLPAFVTPSLECVAEARVVAAGGEEEDRRWQVADDDRVGGPVYTLDVILWNAKIVVPFQPDQQTGHLFFPAYKQSTVLVELGLYSARLARHLDWGPGVQLAQDTQGDHILLGFSETTETSICHQYVSNKPELVLKRFDKGDTQTIAFREGVTTLHVEEEEFAGSMTETFDVSLQVELARGELTGSIGGGMSEVSGKFGSAAGGLSSSIGGTSAEVQGELQSTTSTVGAKIDEAKGELDQLRSSLSEGSAPVSSAAKSASAELKAALE